MEKKTRIKYLVVGVAMLIIGSLLMVSIVMQSGDHQETDFDGDIEVGYETTAFYYQYLGDNSPSGDVYVHTGTSPSEGEILHEYSELSSSERFDLDTRDLAEDSDAHLETLSDMYITLELDSGTTYRIAEFNSEEFDPRDAIYGEFNTETTPNGDARVRASTLQADSMEVRVDDETIGVLSEEGESITVLVEDYYSDSTGDGVFETKESFTTHITYNEYTVDIGEGQFEGFEEPEFITERTLGEQVVEIRDTSPYESVGVYTPEGNYVGEDRQDVVLGLQNGDEVTVHSEATRYQIVVERNGNIYSIVEREL